MNSADSTKLIDFIISSFYRTGLWHLGDAATVKETRYKIFCCIYYSLFPISLIAGAISSDDREESIFLLMESIGLMVLVFNMYFLIWKQECIIDMLRNIRAYSMENQGGYFLVSWKLKWFTKLVAICFCAAGLACIICAAVGPCLGSGNNLFFSIAFPLDWKNNDIAYWIANIFLITELFITLYMFLFSFLTWYLIMMCALRYEVLGHQIKNMGSSETNKITANKAANDENYQKFFRDLTVAIESHQQIRE